MLDALKAFLSGDEGLQEVDGRDPSQLAAASLLVEAAMIDDAFAQSEKDHIQEVLLHLFDLSDKEANVLIDEAESAVSSTHELYHFTKAVREAFDYDRRVELLQMLWEVVYADGVLDDFEANLVRRVSGLLYIADQDSGRARKRALTQLGHSIKS